MTILAGVVAGAVALALVTVVVCFVRRRKRRWVVM